MESQNSEKVLTIAYLNTHGQTNLTEAKQVQIQDFLKYNKIDVAHLQETDVVMIPFQIVVL